MTNSKGNISLRTAALTAGLAYVMMLATPYAEFYVSPSSLFREMLRKQ